MTPPDLHIRRARPDDAEALCALHIASIRTLCAAHYTPAQIEAWSGAKAPEHYHRPIREHVYFIAECSDGAAPPPPFAAPLAGFVHMLPGDGSLLGLYLHPDHVGRGLGRILLERVERVARALDHEALTLQATLNAVPFYTRMGFQSVAEETVTIRDVAVPCVRMRKVLVHRPVHPPVY